MKSSSPDPPHAPLLGEDDTLVQAEEPSHAAVAKLDLERTAAADELAFDDPAVPLDPAALRQAKASARAKLFGQPEEPTRIGRFVILQRLGGGGMGVVYAAYDPQLDRKVALKLLHSAGPSQTQLQERLVREAKSMAKISHPNVVTVHEVGTFEGRVFVAMEYIAGQTLSAWLASQQRSWAEIRDAFVSIGQGLAAAHRVGVVHRDFKPENVMVAEDESHGPRVIVLDFGLAVHAPSAASQREPDEPRADAATADTAPVEERLTRTGAVLGTPAYMAPEQHRAAANVDARADQFSFAVSLFEAVYGRRPFPADTYAELAQRVSEGDIELPEQRGDMPLRAYRATLRALEVDPQRRFADMADMLTEIGHDPSAARRRWLQLGAGAVVVAALIVGVSEMGDDPACDRAKKQLSRAWSKPVQTRAAEAFNAVDRPYADAALQTVHTEVDDYVKRWSDAHERVCDDGTDMSESERIGGVVCLQWRAQELEATTSLLTQADAEVVEHAVEVLAGLTPPEACMSEQALRTIARLPDDPSLRDGVLERRAALAHTQSLADAGKLEQALSTAERIRDDEITIEVPSLAAEAVLRSGKLRRQLGDLPAAERELSDAAYASIASDRSDLAVDAVTELVWLLGTDRANFDDAVPWMRLGEALQRQGAAVGGPTKLQLAIGSMFATTGRHAEALEVFQEAVREQRAQGEPGSLVDPLLWLSRSLADVGRFDDADDRLEEALAIATEHRGGQHPDVARVLVRRGRLAAEFGRVVQAKASFEAARDIVATVRGEDHPALAAPLTGLAQVAWATGRFDDALALTDRVLELGRTDHADATLVDALVVRAWIYTERSRTLDADAAIDEALAIARRHGAAHPLIAMPLVVRAETHRRAGRPAEALRYLDRAKDLLASTFGPADPRRHTLAVLVGLSLRDDGQLPRAADVLARAREELMACCTSHHRLPQAELGLATTLQRLGKPQHAQSLRESARARYAAIGRSIPSND